MSLWFRPVSVRRFDEGCKAFAKGRFAKAAAAWKRAAAVGHAEAAVRLGDMFAEGAGVLRSLVDAKHWYGVAAERGVARAQRRLAELCLSGGKAPVTAAGALAALSPNGVSLERDDVTARRWALAAAEQGDTAAQALIGYLLASGRGGAPDPEQAAHWYRLAAEKGVARAQLGLGTLLAGRFLGEPAYAEAREWLSKAAAQGVGTAMYYLGVLHQQGLGVPADGALALDWFRQAAKAGSAEGQRALGQAYLSGSIVERDLASAEAWLRKAARGGDVEAMAGLGDLYAREVRNPVDALEWYRSAADHGHKGAQLMISRMEARDAQGRSAGAPDSPPPPEGAGQATLSSTGR